MRSLCAHGNFQIVFRAPHVLCTRQFAKEFNQHEDCGTLRAVSERRYRVPVHARTMSGDRLIAGKGGSGEDCTAGGGRPSVPVRVSGLGGG